MKQLSLGILSTLLLANSAFSSTLGKEVQDSSLVVYNGNVGLVHEKRSLHVKSNDTTIVYEGVASTIETDSVNIKLTDSIQLYSQQYRFDKLTQQKLLNAHIGKKIEVRILKNAKDFKIITATLLSANSNRCIVRTSNSKIITVNADDVIFKTIPQELITKPSLVWNIQTDKDLTTELELDYLIRNISWKSDYILNVSKDSANLSGWITVDNRSGKRFEDTTLNVLAGKINMAKREPVYRDARYSPVMAVSAEPVAHVALEGYHFYTIPFKVTLANNEKTQVKFITKNNISIEREYKARVSHPLYLHSQSKHDVTQYINIKGLDLALPKGIVRTYSSLGKQSILLGQSNLKHTPKNSPIHLKIGTNFDIKVKETLKERDDSKYRLNSTVEYSVKNSSNEEKTLKLLIPFNRHKDSKIKTSHPFKYVNGNMLLFTLKVPAEGSKKFSVNFIAKR